MTDSPHVLLFCFRPVLELTPLLQYCHIFVVFTVHKREKNHNRLHIFSLFSFLFFLNHSQPGRSAWMNPSPTITSFPTGESPDIQSAAMLLGTPFQHQVPLFHLELPYPLVVCIQQTDMSVGAHLSAGDTTATTQTCSSHAGWISIFKLFMPNSDPTIWL